MTASPLLQVGDLAMQFRGLAILRLLGSRACIAFAGGPRQRLGDAQEQERRMIAALEAVGLDPPSRHRYPAEFSGRQRQRIAVARALLLAPTAALGRSIQRQILDLLRAVQARPKLTYLSISHDLAVVEARKPASADRQAGTGSSGTSCCAGDLRPPAACLYPAIARGGPPGAGQCRSTIRGLTHGFSRR